MNRSLAVSGATRSLHNARGLLEDSKLLFRRERYSTSYALAIFALEETAKGFVFHWVADGNLTETDLRKLIYSHRRKHAIIQLVDFFERGAQLFLSKFEPLLRQGRKEVTLEFTLDEMRNMIETAQKAASGEHLHLLIHAQQRREISLYVGICDRCEMELLGPWLITKSDAQELLRYAEEHVARIESLVRNCKRHESGTETEEGEPVQLRLLARTTVGCLERAARLECRHVLCSSSRRPSRKTPHTGPVKPGITWG